MDEKQFLERLTEVAEWSRPKIGDADPRRPKRPGRPSREELEWEENEQAHLGEEIKTGPNDTIPPMVTKIKPIVKLCDDCGKMCENRRVDIRLCSYPIDHFRHHCKSCGMTKNPLTGQFDLEPGIEMQNAFRKYWYNRMKK